jgi:hypothetical protein
LANSKIEPNLAQSTLDKRDGLDTDYVKPLAAANVFAAHWVIPPHHVALCFGKTRPVAVISATRELRFLAPYHPFNLVIALLPTVRTGHYVRPLFRPLVKKITLFHPTPHPGLGTVCGPNPICNPASDAPLQARVMHNHPWATKPGTHAGRKLDE